jgi:signal transduction histidine kinase
LVDIIKHVVDNLLTTAGSKQIELQFAEPATVIPKVKGDKIKLEEVVNNLVANAIHYTNPNGKIVVSVESNGIEVTTHIADNGKGIPKEALPNLFTKFFRVRSAMDPEGSVGTGLGLYISKNIVELHRGKIWVNSEFGKGSVFSFSIPAQ